MQDESLAGRVHECYNSCQILNERTHFPFHFQAGWEVETHPLCGFRTRIPGLGETGRPLPMVLAQEPWHYWRTRRCEAVQVIVHAMMIDMMTSYCLYWTISDKHTSSEFKETLGWFGMKEDRPWFVLWDMGKCEGKKKTKRSFAVFLQFACMTFPSTDFGSFCKSVSGKLDVKLKFII